MPNENQLQQNESSFDLAELILFLWQKKIRIILLAAILFVFGAYYVKNLPKVYVAESTLLLSESTNTFSISDRYAAFAGEDYGRMDTYMEFMRSRQFLQNVVNDLNLQNIAEYKLDSKQVSEVDRVEHAIMILQSRISLSKVGDTDLLRVKVDAYSPNVATDIANHLGEAFFIYYLDKGREKADIASAWLNRRLELVQDELNQAEQELQSFLFDNKLMDVASRYELATTEISALQQEKLLNDKLLASSKATFEQIRLAKGNEKELLQIPWVLSNNMIVDVRSKILKEEQKFAELSNRYKYKHHKYIAVQTSLNTLKGAQTALLEKLISSLEQEMFDFSTRGRVLAQQIELAKEKHSDLGKHEIQVAKLRRNLASKQRLYDVFLERLQETEIIKDVGSQEEFAVMDYATIPSYPAKPKVLMLLAVLLIMSAVFSSGFWLLLHLISDRKTRYLQLLRNVEVPLLAEIPKLPKGLAGKTLASMIIMGEKNYQYSEAIRSLRSSMMIRSNDEQIRIIAITGVNQEAEKSYVGINLAESFAHLERSLILDADLRNPHVSKAFGIDKKFPGLTNFLSRKAPISTCLFRDTGSQLTVLPSGKAAADPLVHISKSRFDEVVKKLGVFYDRLVIETPPVNSYSDALVVSKLVDGVILVCDIENTESVDLLDAIQRLRDAGAPILGVVFDKVKNVKSNVPKRSAFRKLLRKVLGS
jgi:receptor protein-tyrosine kinase